MDYRYNNVFQYGYKKTWTSFVYVSCGIAKHLATVSE